MSKRLAFLESMVASGNADAFALYALAMEYRTAGRIDEALGTFETLRERDATYVPMYLMAGQTLHEAGRDSVAVVWLRDGCERARAKGDSHALGELEALLAQLTEPA